MYEAMIIFPDALKEDALEAAMELVRSEITKAGGHVESATRLGRRTFARPMKKQEAGQYAVVTFRMPGDKIRGLVNHFKLNEDIFRLQIVRVPTATTAAAAKGGKS